MGLVALPVPKFKSIINPPPGKAQTWIRIVSLNYKFVGRSLQTTYTIFMLKYQWIALTCRLTQTFLDHTNVEKPPLYKNQCYWREVWETVQLQLKNLISTQRRFWPG